MLHIWLRDMPSAEPSPSRSFSALAVALLAASATLFLGRCGGNPGVTAAGQRGGARELAFTLLDGQAWRLSQERGHVVAVNLWATWCGPCRSETPTLVRVSNDLSGEGFRVLGVSLDTGSDRNARVRSFAAVYRVRYPVAFPDALSQIESGLEGIPTTLLFDRQGRAAKVYVGAISERTLRSDVAELLREP